MDSRTQYGRIVALVLVCPVLLLVGGCSGGGRAKAERDAEARAMVWPAPPEPARLAYEASITRASDLGIRRSGLARFAQWLVGSEKGNESLVKPFGLTLDDQDNLCVTDTGANCIYFYDRKARKSRRYDKAGKISFQSPVAVAKEGDTLVVADTSLRCIFVMNLDGKLRSQITNRLERPSGVLLRGGQIFVTDALRHSVVVFDLQGRFVREFGKRGPEPGQLNFPTHIAALGGTNLLVTDSMNCRVQVLDFEGRFISQVGRAGDRPGYFGRPKGVASDSFGHVYVADALFDNLQIFDAAGQFLLTVCSPGDGPGHLWLPNGIAISRQNEVFVADSYNRRVQVFRYVGPR